MAILNNLSLERKAYAVDPCSTVRGCIVHSVASYFSIFFGQFLQLLYLLIHFCHGLNMVTPITALLRLNIIVVYVVFGLFRKQGLLHIHLHLLGGRIFGVFFVLNLGLLPWFWDITILNYGLNDWVFQFEEASFFSHVF